MRIVLAIVALLLIVACRATTPTTTTPTPTPTTTTTTTNDAPPASSDLPGVHVDLARRTVELDAHVSPRAGEWLELIACAGRSLEHESLVTIDALPSHVHLALLLIGLEPGKPQTWRQEDGQFVLEPAAGDAICVQFILEGELDPIPVSDWVVDQKTNQPMAPTTWLFAGSKFVQIKDQPVYGADVNGPVVTLVHFGDEVAAPAGTDLTNLNDEQQWNARPDGIPPAGTPLRVRLSPAPPEVRPPEVGTPGSEPPGEAVPGASER